MCTRNMPFKIVVLLLFLGVSACASVSDISAVTRAVTYNVRLDIDVDGDDAWPYRQQDVATLLRFYAPDILGLQEVRLHQLHYLKANLDNYSFIGVGRDDGREGGEFSPLAFLTARYKLREQGTFWLSETPDRPSVGFDAAFPRIVSWARLVERASNRRILALNTHWDHLGADARLESGHIVRDWIARHRKQCESVILLGDFNATPDELPIRALTDPSDERDDAVFLALPMSETPPFGPPGTFNGFDILSARGAPIDHILVSRPVRVLRHGTLTQHYEGRLPSDHYPVLADLELSSCGESEQAPAR